MKVAIGIDRAKRGGISVSSSILCSELCKLGCDAEIVITEASKGAYYDRIKAKGVPVHAINEGEKNLKKRVLKTVDFLGNYDCAFFTMSKEIQYAASALPPQCKLFKVIRNPLEILNGDVLWNQRALDGIVCISPTVREFLVLLRPNPSIHLIPNSTDFVLQTDNSTNSETLRIAYLGGFSQFHKGVLVLPAIADKLSKKGVEAEWVLAGEGSEKEQVKVLFKEANISARFESLNRKDTCNLLSSSDFLIVPSNFEAFGLIVIEAMATGCIPICSNAPVFSWILGNHSEDLQVMNNRPEEYVDIIQSLLDDNERAKNIKQDLLRRQRQYFSPAVMASSYLLLINKPRKHALFRNGRFRIPLRKRLKNSKLGCIYRFLRT